MQAVIYTRVSDDHSGRSRSTEDQEADCRSQCERQGWPIKAVLCDQDIGASRYSSGTRESYERLREVLEPGDVLVTWEASRSQRDLEAYVRLRSFSAERGVLWSYNGRLYDMNHGDDRFSTGLDVLLSEKEVEQMRDRTMRGKRSAAALGRPGGKPPWGYRTERDETTGRPINFVFDNEEAPLVRRAVRDILSGRSLTSITAELNADGGKPGIRPGSHTVLRRCLINPQIAGFRVYQGEVIGKAAWEPIIEPDLQRKLVAYLGQAGRNTNKTGSTAPNSLLSFIAICGVCKKHMRTGRIKSHGKVVQRYYVCSSPQRCVSRRLDPVDKLVEEYVIRRAEKTQPYDEEDPSIQEDLQELEALEKRLESFVDESATDFTVSPQSLARIESKILSQIDAVKTRIMKKSTPRDPLGLFGPNARARWDELVLQDKRKAIRSAIKVTINKSTDRSKKFNPDDIDIVPIDL